MKIIILGVGQVGGTLAENLVGERNDITIVDTNADLLDDLQDKYDLRVVAGNGAHPDVLRRAGADDADLLIAVTSSDETNMIACQVAYSIFNTPKKIARIRSEEYIRYKDQLFHNQDAPVDNIISPEQLVTNYIKRLIDYPGALQVMEFAGGRASLVAVKPIMAVNWWAMLFPPCASTFPISTPVSQLFTVKVSLFAPPEQRLLRPMMKYSSSRIPDTLVQSCKSCKSLKTSIAEL